MPRMSELLSNIISGKKICECWCLESCSSMPVPISNAGHHSVETWDGHLGGKRNQVMLQQLNALRDKLARHGFNLPEELAKRSMEMKAEDVAKIKDIDVEQEIDKEIHDKLTQALNELNPETPDGKIDKEHKRLEEIQKDIHWAKKTEVSDKRFTDALLLCGQPYVIDSILVGFKPVRTLVQRADRAPTCVGCIAVTNSPGYRADEVY